MARLSKPRVLNPSNPILWCKEGAARIEAGYSKGAIYSYEESLKIKSYVWNVWYSLGVILEEMGH